jgi:hypothetical protein
MYPSENRRLAMEIKTPAVISRRFDNSKAEVLQFPLLEGHRRGWQGEEEW